MEKSEQMTVKQHYIPQVYLRGFSPEYQRGKNETPHSKYTIFCHDISSKEQIYKPIPIGSICYRKNLYEVTGETGEIVLTNYLENFFTVFEKKFGFYRSKLEQKAFNKENYYKKCFLTSEEKLFWLAYIVIQILRSPDILKEAEILAKETWGDKINEKQSMNIARLFCLPFFKELKPESKEATLFNSLFEPLGSMSFAIGVDMTKRIITSDCTPFIYSKEYPCDEYDEVIFPITSEICLFLFGNEEKGLYPSNVLFPIDDEARENVFRSIVTKSKQKIYSNHLLSREEKRLIKDTKTEMEVCKCRSLTLSHRQMKTPL